MTLQDKINRLKNLMYVRPQRPAVDFLELDFGGAVDELIYKKRGGLFLNLYSSEELLDLFCEMEINDKISECGFSNIKMKISGENSFDHRLRLYSEWDGKDVLLMELVVKEGIFEPKKTFIEDFSFRNVRMLMIEWLSLQNPNAKFEKNRPRLPGQKFPGLGILMDLERVLVCICERLGYEGVVDVPEYFHGALMYSPKFFFYDPEMEGKLRAMMRDLKDIPLATASTAVLLNCVINEVTGEYVDWSPGEQILPISREIEDYFKSDGYRDLVLRAEMENSFAVDNGKLEMELESEVNKFLI
ncbi:MAG: hypothetical protein JW984_00805 [Deltaproteobacteria bacterium]|uniref:Uncharacterized protein n=1 Tax=Candidatus Zymogenus saltonus TaxID=2844893 RepID=A0A9D8KBB0_9DELT|nr:hypothetical protein [Candidatus Zymogenus saltonus]